MPAGGSTSETDGAGADNVIRFPKDWFGPREDLVPFGPGADRAEARLAEDADETAALTASDFWGEGAGALHQPVDLPDEDPVAASSPESLAESQMRAQSSRTAMLPRRAPFDSLRLRLSISSFRDASRSRGLVVVFGSMVLLALLLFVLAPFARRTAPPAAHRSAAVVSRDPPMRIDALVQAARAVSFVSRDELVSLAAADRLRARKRARAEAARAAAKVKRRRDQSHRSAASPSHPATTGGSAVVPAATGASSNAGSEITSNPTDGSSAAASSSSTPPSSAGGGAAGSSGTSSGPAGLGGVVGSQCNPQCQQ